MRALYPDNLAEHSLEVAMFAHMLALIANIRYGHSIDAGQTAVCALYHDAAEIITGDIPTPIKHGHEHLLEAYKEVEKSALASLTSSLPEDLRASYAELLSEDADNDSDSECVYMWRLVHAADKLSAYLQCIKESECGNPEFRSAGIHIKAQLDALADELPELADFMREQLPSFGKNLDNLVDGE